jgi:ADP-ribose pyrophosphatase
MDSALSKYLDLLHNSPDLIANKNALIKIILDEDAIKKFRVTYENKLIAIGKPKEWAEIGLVYSDPYIVILRDLVEFPGGSKGSYFRILNQADLQEGQGVVVLPSMNGKYLLLHQYRHPIRSWSYEFPRGFGEPGILAEQQAKNEILEEIKGEISNLIDLGVYHSNTGLEGNTVKLFFASLNSIGEPERLEGIESYRWVTLTELENMIATASITDGFTIAAYTRAKLLGLLK